MLRTLGRSCFLVATAGAIALASATGCNSGCSTLVGSTGIQLNVSDSITGRSLDSVAFVAVTSQRANPDSASGYLLTDNPLSMTVNRSGSYTVRVEADGYAPWVRTVRIPTRQEACDGGLFGAAVTARLVHVSPG